MTKNALITGATGGLGAATARLLVNKGWHVYAADFDKKALGRLKGEDDITPVFIDVTDAASVQAAAAKVGESTDGLDGIVNFAGILAIGSMIEMDEPTMQRVLDVNVMGTFRVNQAFFQLLKARRGRIVNISSETGWQSGGPFNGAYGASKHAIEAYSDSLRRELALLGMPVIKVQPGPFKTDMVASIEANFERAAENSDEFEGVLNKLKTMAVKEAAKGNDPAILAKVIHEALTARFPRAAYSVKPDPARTVLEYVPTRVADTLLKSVLSTR